MKQSKVLFLILASGLFFSSCHDTKPVTHSREEGEFCDEINNCAEEYVCVSGTCRVICHSDNDCGKKQHCKNNYCVGNPGGDCRTGWSGGACDVCAEGYFGPNCQPCIDCGAHGKCNETLKGNGKCTCDTGWEGPLCDECAENYFGESCQSCPDCHGHGSCSDGLTGSGCVCRDNYTGTTCEECAKDYFGPDCQPCQCGPHGRCDAGISGSGSCQCLDGFTDTHCDRCADSRYTGADCNECADKRFSGKNCDECLDGATDIMTDGNGRTYKTVCIAKQFWMAENMNNKYRDFYHANGSVLNDDQYGLLYNWYTANRVCPAGWYLPTVQEVLDMAAYLTKAGMAPTINAVDNCTDKSGFCAVPSGYYVAATEKYSDFNSQAYLWTSSEKECSDYNDCAHAVYIGQFGAAATNGDIYSYRSGGAAVRCAKDSCADKRFTGKDCDLCIDGAVGSMTDKAGKSYKTVCINGRFWMAQNMAYQSEDAECHAFPARDADYVNKFGCLYDWNSAINICPDGWVLPQRQDYEELLSYVSEDGRLYRASEPLRDSSFDHGSNLYGFDLLGACSCEEGKCDSEYQEWQQKAVMWTQNKMNQDMALEVEFSSMEDLIYEGSVNNWNSVRCVEAKACENDLFTGKNCDQCKNKKKTFVSGCTQCKNTLMTGENCSICRNGGYGKNCLSYGTMKDKAGKEYRTVEINGQTWMAENMQYVTEAGTYYHAGGSPENDSIFGLLYKWDTAKNDVCPEGWHLPTKKEFDALLTYADNNRISESTFLSLIAVADSWTYHSKNGGDDFGFGGLPAGTGNGYNYSDFWAKGMWWSADMFDNNRPYCLIAQDILPLGNAVVWYNYIKSVGHSVRCVKN